MAVAPTGAIYKALKFDGVSSRTYGVYITGEAVYNAPERDVEMITIPGRNGSFALDNGRFQNIEVSYPAGIFAETEADFREAISDFRNFLCSRKGYVRLQDEYNPNEYRMAVYKSGLEVEPAMLKAGEFEITFDCKPQRWLTSGETAVSVTSGDTITNPTLFEARPLLEVHGYGNIDVNGDEIIITDGAYGEITVYDNFRPTEAARITKTVNLKNMSLLNIGDMFAIGYHEPWQTQDIILNKSATSVSSTSIISKSANIANASIVPGKESGLILWINPLQFTYGTSSTVSVTATWSVTYNNGTKQYTTSLSYAYDGNTTISCVFTSGGYNQGSNYEGRIITYIYDVVGNSTKTSLMNPLYIDFDIGEAYGINNGDVVTQNNIVTLPNDLNVLKPGSNTVTFDNTITDLKIVPRWWKV